ncbi:MAG: ABC transporter substrate-binding protein [Acidilobaceae archaeon]
MDRRLIGVALLALLLVVALGFGYYLVFREKQEGETGSQRELEVATVRVGVLPVIDSLPYHIAVVEGLDREHGLSLEIVVFPSARARDDAFIAGGLDAIMTDLVGAMLLRDRGANLTIVLSKHATFYLVVSPKLAEQVGGMRDLPNYVKTIAISYGTVIDFTLHKMLAENNLDPQLFEIRDIRVIVERFTAVLEGRVDAAVLPEPWGPLAQTRGARIVYSITIPIVVLAIDPSRIDVSTAERLAVLVIEASRLYRSDTEKYRSILEDPARIGVPREFAGWWVPRDLISPRYAFTGVDGTVFSEVARWVYDKGLVKRLYSEAELVLKRS